jgi:hypothetical protein
MVVAISQRLSQRQALIQMGTKGMAPFVPICLNMSAIFSIRKTTTSASMNPVQ